MCYTGDMHSKKTITGERSSQCGEFRTVQFSSKVTFARIPDMSCTYLRRVSHEFRTRPCLAKRGMALIYVLLQLYRKVFCLHRHVLHTFQMCSNVTLELSLYRSLIVVMVWNLRLFFLLSQGQWNSKNF